MEIPLFPNVQMKKKQQGYKDRLKKIFDKVEKLDETEKNQVLPNLKNYYNQWFVTNVTGLESGRGFSYEIPRLHELGMREIIDETNGILKDFMKDFGKNNKFFLYYITMLTQSFYGMHDKYKERKDNKLLGK